MKTIGTFTLLLFSIIIAVCRADLPDTPSSTQTPAYPTPAQAGLSSTSDLQTSTLDETSTPVEPASASAGPSATLDQQTPRPNQQTASPSGRTSRPFQPTPTVDVLTPTLTVQTATSTVQTATSTVQTATSTVQTATSTGETATSTGQSSTSSGQTPTSDGQRPTSSSPAPVLCGPVPRNIHRCIGGPKLVKPEWAYACTKYTDECELMACVYEKARWMNNGEIDKEKLSAHFSQISKKHPEWQDAVKQALEYCIWDVLKPQGVYLKCPAYDVTSCIETAFVRNTQPSQWSNSTDCEYTRKMASACPFCPEDCFAPQVPYGSCNACLGLALQKPSSLSSPSN